MRAFLSGSVLLAAMVCAGAAFACEEPEPENLLAGPSVKAGLTRAYERSHPGARVDGPIAGSTFYGRAYGYTFYAVARFEVDGRVGRPVVFTRYPRHPWTFRRQTGGAVCDTAVPPPLLELWGLAEWSGGTRRGCYVLPG
jgi:hypothetical protein